MSHRTRAYFSDENGAAAAEMAMFIVFLAPLLLNLIAIGAYAYQRIQVENAAQAGAQAARRSCPTPPASSCTTLAATVQSAVQGTTLGSAITWNSGTVNTDSGYLCPDGANNALTASTVSSTCTSTNQKPGYYIKVTASYTFRSILRMGTVASLLPTTLSRSAWTRIA